MINEEIKKLIQLQETDKQIDSYQRELLSLPKEIESKRVQIQEAKSLQEEEKKKLVQSQVQRKEKEMELGSQEEKLRKNEGELNSIKSNEAYRVMLQDIENSKFKKGQIEDEILVLMEEADLHAKELKRLEQEFFEKQKKIEEEVNLISHEIKKIEQTIQEKTKIRDEFSITIENSVLDRYQFIRKNKKNALSFIHGETCGNCHTVLTQSLINEVRKGKDLVLCESCSTILYIPETQVTPTI